MDEGHTVAELVIARGFMDHRRTSVRPVCLLTYRMHRRVTVIQFFAIGCGTSQACGASSGLRTRLPLLREDVAGVHCCVPRPEPSCAPLPGRGLRRDSVPCRSGRDPAVSGFSFTSHSLHSRTLSSSAGEKRSDATYESRKSGLHAETHTLTQTLSPCTVTQKLWIADLVGTRTQTNHHRNNNFFVHQVTGDALYFFGGRFPFFPPRKPAGVVRSCSNDSALAVVIVRA